MNSSEEILPGSAVASLEPLAVTASDTVIAGSAPVANVSDAAATVAAATVATATVATVAADPDPASAVPAPVLAAALADTPEAVTFASFGLDARIVRALTDQGYSIPTPIQAQAIPVVLQGRDVMGAAQTGTGKTAGFALPIIQKLLPLASPSTSPARHPVRALILTPTRELADQVAANVAAYARHTSLRSVVVFGGVDMKPQTAALRAGVEIVIATPGRLLDHVEQKSINLSQTTTLVLDEADRMLDMGFLPDLQRIVNLLPTERQSLMFSATFSTEIKKLANTFLRDPVTIETARRNATAENVSQTVYEIASEYKRAAVAHIVRTRNLKQVIVFTNTKIGASRVARELEREGINAVAIHGDKTQQDRMKALDGFKKGEIEILVATDVAARGLDIVELPCVINYDLPYSPEDYVHRIGRTGRAGASGDAISLMAPAEERLLLDIERLIKTKVERKPLEGFMPPARTHGHESGGEGERSSRERGRERSGSDRGERGRGERFERSAPRSAPRAGRSPVAPVDEWFLKPYEPRIPPQTAAASAASPASSGPKSTVRKLVAALLGGIKKD